MSLIDEAKREADENKARLAQRSEFELRYIAALEDARKSSFLDRVKAEERTINSILSGPRVDGLVVEALGEGYYDAHFAAGNYLSRMRAQKFSSNTPMLGREVFAFAWIVTEPVSGLSVMISLGLDMNMIRVKVNGWHSSPDSIEIDLRHWLIEVFSL